MITIKKEKYKILQLTSTSGQIASAAGIWAGEFTKFGWPSVNYTAAVAKLGVSEATQV